MTDARDSTPATRADLADAVRSIKSSMPDSSIGFITMVLMLLVLHSCVSSDLEDSRRKLEERIDKLEHAAAVNMCPAIAEPRAPSPAPGNSTP